MGVFPVQHELTGWLVIENGLVAVDSIFLLILSKAKFIANCSNTMPHHIDRAIARAPGFIRKPAPLIVRSAYCTSWQYQTEAVDVFIGAHKI